jgi:hypothetical protein
MPANRALKSKRIWSLGYEAAIVSSCIVIGCMPFIRAKDLLQWIIILTVMLAAFVSLGVLHLWLSNTRLKKFTTKTTRGFKNTALLTFSILWSLVIFYLLVDSNLFLLSIANSAAFILPYAIAYTYKRFESIPDPQYEVWYKKDNLIENKAFVFLASVPLKFKLAPALIDNNYTTFASTLPAQMELGKAFHYFLIQQQNNNRFIETEDESGEPVGWQFYLEKLWGYHLVPLNPDLNLWQNQVKPHSTIVAKRVVFSPNILPPHFQTNHRHELYQY